MFGENVAKMQRGTVDRISDLPDFILHNILPILDTKEVCRASVLSKRWYDVWSSIPVLDFQLQYFKKYGIMKLNLELPMVNENIELLVDKWLKIVVKSQIEELEIGIQDITIEEIETLSLPWTRKVNEAIKFVDGEIMQLNFKASPPRTFVYHGLFYSITWPWSMNVVALKSLKKLDIVCAIITDDTVF
ncbi:putative F-box/LRR-repeat protein At5g02700 [Silene latifolia]|uniref:putative F-box/LRR-repeat protein At5g02700 n=1 Tax=Silene latifolia TaxID=37657 RepID=UPI003D77F2E0